MTAPTHPILPASLAFLEPDWVAEHPTLWGRDLRYVLTVLLFTHGVSTVAELVARVDALGFRVEGRPSKQVSDALRWEVGRGRAVRLRRGRYAPGTMPASTSRRIHLHVRRLVAGDPDLRRRHR